MRKTRFSLISTGLALSLSLALGACRGGGDDSSGDDVPTPDAPPVGGSVKVKEVQADAMPVGTKVELRGVIVTAIDSFGNRTGDLWVQDAEGGAFSGVKVFGAPLDQVAGIAVGDIVDITNAEKDEFALTSDMTGRKVTEIKGAGGGMMTITKKGAGTVPAPQVVDAKMLASLAKADREAEWEKWEGVLIKVTNARQLAASRAFGSMPGPDSNEFRITGIARVQSVLTDLNADAAFGVCYESITGVGDYFFNDLVLPRTAADIVTGGTGCNPMATSVLQVQTTPNTELVNLTNVFVTGRDDSGNTSKGFWVSDAATAAVNTGVYVFTRDVAAPDTFQIGAKVNVQGAPTEFDFNGPNNTPPAGDTLTQVADPTFALGTAAPADPAGGLTPLDATVPQVNAIGATGEPYEGVLVRLQNVKVTNNALGNSKIELTDNNGAKVIMDDDSFAAYGGTTMAPMNPANGVCYSSLIGIMNVQLNDDIRTINPRRALDMTVGTGCNN